MIFAFLITVLNLKLYKYPDIVSLVQSFFKATPRRTSFILDSEIVAIDQDNGTLQSFQTLSNRARKDVLLQNIRVSVCVFAFDVMYLDGEVRHRFSGHSINSTWSSS